MTTPSERFADALARLRQQAISQRDIAATLGTRPQFISDIKAGRCALSPAFAFRMEHAYGLSHDWLLTGEGEPWVDVEPAGTSEQGAPGLEDEFLPLLEEVVPGDPRQSSRWNGAQYPVLAHHARPAVDGGHRYVLRVSADDACEGLQPEDFVLIENNTAMGPELGRYAVCPIRRGERNTLGAAAWDERTQFWLPTDRCGSETRRDAQTAEVLGVCVAIIWRRLVGR